MKNPGTVTCSMCTGETDNPIRHGLLAHRGAPPRRHRDVTLEYLADKTVYTILLFCAQDPFFAAFFDDPDCSPKEGWLKRC